MMFTWASEAASQFGIPRLCFHGTGLPDQIEFIRRQLSVGVEEEIDNELLTKMVEQGIQAEISSYGIVVNSFHELEPAYSDHYRKVMGRKAWHIGPVSLCNTDINDKAQPGEIASVSEHECLRWLDSKEPNSVLYVCFGSMARFSVAQLLEMAMGLEASGQHFIWVEWSRWFEDKKTIVKREDIKKAVNQLMVGEEAEEMRNRAKSFKEMAKRATEEEGSSNSDLNALLEELKLNCP
ncbi:hypothetical protein Patl1_35488 [Pistacia atlantica]|nr:hypothetical protein Patl1_35488 [Pistacia atlantica]